jgi:hypothetical protein
VVDPSGGKGGTQRLGDVLLTDDLGEGGRPVFAIERKVSTAIRHSRTLTTGADTQAGRVEPAADAVLKEW